MALSSSSSPQARPAQRTSATAALLLWIPLVPVIAAYATATVFVVLPQATSGYSALLVLAVGASVTFGAWLLLWLVAALRRVTSAAEANLASFSDLWQRSESLLGRTRAMPEDVAEAHRSRIREIESSVNLIRSELATPGVGWQLGSRFVSVRVLVHRAEEACMQVAPIEELLIDALQDRLRIEGSVLTREAKEQLLTELVVAQHRLSGTAVAYLGKTVGNVTIVPPVQIALPASEGQGRPEEVAEARAALRHVRQTLNTFRDGLREGLVRARLQVLIATAMTGVIVYLLVAVGVTVQVAQRESTTASGDLFTTALILFLVGAVSGQLQTLRSLVGNDAYVDDVGLGWIWLVFAPLVCGLAGVFGVLVFSLLVGLAGGRPTAFPDIYSLVTNPIVLVEAAVAGVVIAPLLDAVRRTTNKYADAFQSTEPTPTEQWT
jgi:hypothetical protein